MCGDGLHGTKMLHQVLHFGTPSAAAEYIVHWSQVHLTCSTDADPMPVNIDPVCLHNAL